MNSMEEKVLSVLDKELSNAEIRNTTHLSIDEVKKAIRELRKKGKICSYGSTSAQKHMRLATAIEKLFKQVGGLDYRIRNIEQKTKLL